MICDHIPLFASNPAITVHVTYFYSNNMYMCPGFYHVVVPHFYLFILKLYISTYPLLEVTIIKLQDGEILALSRSSGVRNLNEASPNLIHKYIMKFKNLRLKKPVEIGLTRVVF